MDELAQPGREPSSGKFRSSGSGRRTIMLVFLIGLAACAPAGTTEAPVAARAVLDTTSKPANPLPTSTAVPTGDLEGVVMVGDHGLYLHCAGDGSPTVVYLHGAVWDRGETPAPHRNGLVFQDRLADEHRVCVYDRRNVGMSDVVDAVQSPDDAVDDLAALLQEADIQPPYVLLGASFGGLLAYYYANLHPDEVVGMVLLDSPIPDELELEDMYEPEDRYEALVEEDECCSPERIAHFRVFEAASRFVGREHAIPVVYLASTQEPRDPGFPEYNEAYVPLRQAYLDRFSPGKIVPVDAPHFMEPVVPDEITAAIRDVIALASTTAGEAGEPHPAGRIVFGRITRMDDQYGQVVALYAVDSDGGNLVQLTEGESAFPAWSPDGTLIAFTLGQPDGSWQIAVMAADGSDLRVLTDGPGIHEGPTWAPDGTWLAYGYSPTLPDDPDFHTVIYRMNADGSGQELLGDPDAFDVEPRISPDGSSILFQRLSFVGDGSGGTRIQSVLVIRDLVSGAERLIDAAGTAVNHANWSPDGQWIIYNIAGWITGNVDDEHLWRIAADGTGEPVAVTDTSIIEGAFKPWYSPDGSRIVFGCIGAATGGDDALCLIDADGSNLEILIDEPGVHENHFSWGIAASR